MTTDLAARINSASHLTGEFVLRSGATATEYFDKYQFEADPVLLRAIAEAMAPMVGDDVDVLAGLELGGVPIAVMLSQVTGIPTLFVRKEAKTYGTCRLAEGGELAGRRVLIVEDVVTSGGQVAISTGQLREAGAVVERAVCVIDRQAGGTEALAQAGIALTSLYTKADLLATAE
ncbi:orotate phosphoribosyltransferase [Stackebrandtia endophytica]|uniref:Orotate phosphoribosyltransferase n=1 Tax=Stackebrandtia endophytica TaxID=1496996 RepID=A0A543B0W9_9ACTN|nr:orotate phosphoribosyltransferase [Stackebrandtia endophytica]TQL78436.1 orotate phosphoribosyltransferase [Stackebrandtia endophytica]